MKLAAAVAVAVLAATGAFFAGHYAWSTSTAKPGGNSVCVQALDAADQAFDGLAAQIRTTQQAFDQGMSGDVAGARGTLATVQRVPAEPYKSLEQRCRTGG